MSIKYSSEHEDFRIELYKQYISTFKKYISIENAKSIQSENKVFRKRYIPLLKDFNNDAAIIDLGCGSGNILQSLKDAGFVNLFGIDISEQQIEKVLSKRINARKISIFDFIETNKNKFDIIFALDFVEHFQKKELLKLFSGIYNMMSDNSILIIRTPNGDGLFPNQRIYGDLTHLTIFSQNSLIQILRIVDFTEIKFYGTGPVSKNIIGFIRLILWKLITVIVKVIRLVETGNYETILTQEFICVARKKKSVFSSRSF